MLKIKTNNKPRPILDGFQIPGWRKEFDYMDDETFENGKFFMYKSHMYSLDEFIRCDMNTIPALSESFSDWSGFLTDTAFSGILIRICENNEQLIVGRFYE